MRRVELSKGTCLFLVAAVAAIVYVPVVTFGFLNWDDNWLILENPYVRSLSASNFYHILFDFSRRTRLVLGAEYLPVRDIVTACDWAVWNGRPGGFHLTNLVLYLGCCILLYLLLARQAVHPALAVIGALLFVVHPSHVESTAWISDRKSLISMLFMLLALLLYLKATSVRPMRRLTLFLSMGCFVAGGLGKQCIVVFPILLAAYEMLPGGKNLRTLWKSHRWILGTYLLLSLLLAFLHFEVGRIVRMFTARPEASALQLPVFSLALLQHFTEILVFPRREGAFLFMPAPAQVTPAESVAAVVFFVGLLFLLAASWRRMPWLTFAMAWHIVCLLPFLQIMPVQNWLTWRYLFPASAGLGWAVLQMDGLLKERKLLPAVIALSLVVAVAGNFVHGTTRLLPVWRSSEVFWTEALAKDPLNFTAYQNLSKHYSESGRKQKSLSVARALAKAFPGSAQAHFILALRWFAVGNMEQGRRQMAVALSLKPDYKEAWNNLGYYETEAGNHERAMEALGRALEIDPGYAVALNNKGRLFLAQGNVQEAKNFFRRALQADPYNSSARRNLELAEKILSDSTRARRLAGAVGPYCMERSSRICMAESTSETGACRAWPARSLG